MKLIQFLRNRIKEILLLVFSTALSLYLAWVFLTIYFSPDWHGPTTRFDPELGWSTIPSNTGMKKIHVFTTNSMGFRSNEVDPSKNQILLIGDSVTWGSNVGDKEHVSYYLDKKFNKYQVLNLGVSGYGTDQEYLLLKRNIDKLNPRLIIVIICVNNDKMNTTSNEAYSKSKPLFTVSKDIVDQFSGQAETVDPTHLVLASKKISRFSCVNLLYYFQFWGRSNRTCFPKILGEKEARYVMIGLIKKFKKLAKKHHSEIVFVLSPSRLDFDENTSDLTRLKYFKQLLRLTSSEYLDYFKYIKKRNLNVDDIFIDHNHYTPLGHQILADKIYDFINSRRVNMLRHVPTP